MVSVFEFEDYRDFLNIRFKEMPNRGYGQLTLLASHLGVHTTLVSQIFKGRKEITTDQIALVADFLNLNELETEYLVLLVHWQRAGNSISKKIYKKQLQNLKGQSQNLSKRINSEIKLSEDQRAIFYSDWTYTAVRQATAISNINSVDELSNFLNLSKRRIHFILDFLLKTGLCKDENGKLMPGPSSTYLESTSPWIGVHHTHWRQRALLAFNSDASDNLHYTCPLTVSKKDAFRIKEEIIETIQKINSIVDPSPSEKLYGFNIDWFQEGK